jgi:NACHT domain
MPLATAATGIGKQVVTHAARTWLGAGRERAERDAELIDLVRISVRDHFQQRKLLRQLEDLADQIAERLRPVYEHEFRTVPENERVAALLAVVDALKAADLTDDTLFAVDVDARQLARLVRERVPVRRVGLAEPAERLYDAVLDESCMALVQVVKQLPAFQPRALAELLGRFSQVVGDIAEVLHRLPRTTLDAPSGSDHDEEFRARYLAHVSDTLDELEQFGIDVRRYKPRTLVSVAYLSLQVSADPGRRGRGDRPDERWFAEGRHTVTGGSSSLRAEAALAESPRTLLRGDAGSGKTTLLQWLAVTAARSGFSGPLAEWNGCVPFLVRLRSYADRPLPRPEQLLAGVADPLVDLLPPGWVHRQFSSGRALLLVDGVDELVSAQRPAVRRWLQGLFAESPQVRVVVTARPGAADRGWLAAESFAPVLLERMSPLDVAAFCRRWHDAMRDAAGRRAVELPCPVDELPHYERALLRQLDGRRHLRGLARSPLLCAMLCALNLDRRQQLPPDRMALYRDALALLLERRDAEREVPASRAVVLDAGSKLAILQHVAWRLSLAGRAELPRDEVLEMVRRAVARMPNVEYSALDVLQHLLERSGVIREPVLGRVDFVHRTFQEYLAAKEAVEDQTVDVLVTHAHLDQWWETIVMAVGHATPERRAALLSGVLDRADTEPKHCRRLRLLAAACLDTAQMVDPEVTSRVEAAVEALVPPRGQNETRSLALAGGRVLRRLPAALDGLTDASAAACVKTAALIGGPEALRLLARWAPDPRGAVQRALAQVWRYFDPADYAKAVLRDAPLDEGKIRVEVVEHVPRLGTLQHLRDARLALGDSGAVDDLAFLHDAPQVTTELRVSVRGPVDLAPLASCPALETLVVSPGEVSAGWELLTTLRELSLLVLHAPGGGRDLSFLAECPALTRVALLGCTELLELSALAAASRLRYVGLHDAKRLGDLNALSELPDLTSLLIDCALLTGGLAAVTPVLDQLKELGVFSVPTVTSLDTLAGRTLHILDLGDCPITDLAPLGTLQSLIDVRLRRIPNLNLAPLASLPQLRELALIGMNEPVDLSPLAQADHRMRVELWNTPTVGDPGPLVKTRVRRRWPSAGQSAALGHTAHVPALGGAVHTAATTAGRSDILQPTIPAEHFLYRIRHRGFLVECRPGV